MNTPIATEEETMAIDLTVREIIDLAEGVGITIGQNAVPRDELDTTICITKCPDDGVLTDEGEVEHYRLVMYFEDCPEEGVTPLGGPLRKGACDE